MDGKDEGRIQAGAPWWGKYFRTPTSTEGHPRTCTSSQARGLGSSSYLKAPSSSTLTLSYLGSQVSA